MLVDVGGFAVPVHAPSAEGPMPLLLDLHGSNSNGEQQAELSGFRALADAHGFAVAHPSAAIGAPLLEQTLPGGNLAWNVPGAPLAVGAEPPAGARDDVAFLADVIAAIGERMRIRPSAVVVTGFSGGGRMACALADARPDLIAGLAPVAGLRAPHGPGSAVPVLAVHGGDDAVNPLAGGDDPRWRESVHDAAASWAARNGAGPAITAEEGRVTRASWLGAAPVELHVVHGGGHTWPGSAVTLEGLGAVAHDVDASARIWRFFSGLLRG